MTKPIIEQPKSRCDSCNSTERSGYTNTETKLIDGIREGQPYNRIVWRRCKCSNCGKHRVDKSFEFVPETEPELTKKTKTKLTKLKVCGDSKKENSEVRGNSPAEKTEKTVSRKQNPVPEQKQSAKKSRSGKNVG